MSRQIPRANTSKKSRLNLPEAPTGNAEGLITAEEFSKFQMDMQRWADHLLLARIGWHAISSDGYHTIPSIATTRIQFDRTLEDSKSFTKRIMPAQALSMFQIPEDNGGVYNISWSLEWQSSVTTTTTFTNSSSTAATGTYTIPAGVTSIHVIVDGGSGNPNGVLIYKGGTGGRVECDIAVTPGQVYAYNCGGNGDAAVSQCLPGGGLSATAGDAAGGYSVFKHNGDPDSLALVIAGAGGAGGLQHDGAQTPLGGHGGGLTGGDGVANSGLDPNSYGKGGTAAAGGIAGVGYLGQTGGDGSALAGGDYNGGSGGHNGKAGGGGGWFGGGSGAPDRTPGGLTGCSGSGGGGSSHTTGVTGVIHTQGGATFGTSKIVVSYTSVTAIDPTVMIVQVIVSRYNWQTNAHYVKQEMVSADQGYQYLHGAINMWLDARDRVYMQAVTNSLNVVKYLGEHTRLSVNRIGE